MQSVMISRLKMGWSCRAGGGTCVLIKLALAPVGHQGTTKSTFRKGLHAIYISELFVSQFFVN